MMKKLSYSLVAFVVVFSFCACGGKGEVSLQRQLDSLQVAYDEKNADYEDLNGYLGVIAEGLDSIAIQEGMIFKSGEAPVSSREQIRQNLDAYKQTLDNQRKRIAELEEKLKNGNAKSAQLQVIIAQLQQQLEVKDAELEQLRAELDDKNKSIAQLMSHASALQSRNTEQQELIEEQTEALTAQDEMINEAFVRIGGKKELKEQGLLKGGFLKKNKVQYSNVDQKLFERIDIRKKKTFDIPSKKAKLLTPVPEGSYTLETIGDGTRLTITNPTRFWSVSNYLIIQTD